MSDIICWRFKQTILKGSTLYTLLQVPIGIGVFSMAERLNFAKFRMIQPALARAKNRAIR